MKVLHVISGLQKASGVTTFVEALVCELKNRGIEADVLTKGNPVRIEGCSLVHIHGLWDPFLHAAAKVARTAGVPVVWSTHGMTAPWSMRHKWWKKFPAWMLYQRHDLNCAALIHCTTDLEVEWNRKLGFENCFVAPLGTALPSIAQSNVRTSEHSDILRVLFVGRIYPVKGLANLVGAAELIRQSGNQNNRMIRFRIVGPDQARHRAELIRLADSLGVSEMFDWVGPKYDHDLEKEYASCNLLVLPSFTENFGGVVVDALAHGKPVVASKFTPWQVLKDAGCGWWVENDPKSLAAALKEALSRHCTTTASDYDSLSQMGERGRALVAERYTWPAVCDKMLHGYEEVGV